MSTQYHGSDISHAARNAEAFRLRTIFKMELAQAMPTVAHYLAFETDLDAETVEKIMRIAKAEIQAKAGSHSVSAAASRAAFIARKIDAGTLGVAPLQSAFGGSASIVKTHMEAAVERLNAKFEKEQAKLAEEIYR
ncbi:hypothetical protein [Brucella microti]|uniref:hypothetical protein n=1 Tax=Brucella microti TaxID=444163 RepID=UPI0005A15798|nr:hypothetical protein [Brucella microti]